MSVEVVKPQEEVEAAVADLREITLEEAASKFKRCCEALEKANSARNAAQMAVDKSVMDCNRLCDELNKIKEVMFGLIK
jgi:hypothetical protein